MNHLSILLSFICRVFLKFFSGVSHLYKLLFWLYLWNRTVKFTLQNCQPVFDFDRNSNSPGSCYLFTSDSLIAASVMRIFSKYLYFSIIVAHKTRFRRVLNNSVVENENIRSFNSNLYKWEMNGEKNIFIGHFILAKSTQSKKCDRELKIVVSQKWDDVFL